jgi:hypothetical protein
LEGDYHPQKVKAKKFTITKMKPSTIEAVHPALGQNLAKIPDRAGFILFYYVYMAVLNPSN